MTKDFSDILQQSQNVVFFGGAGVSTASGIPDFRSANGLYSNKSNTKYAPEEIISHDFFYDHTEEFYDFYKHHMLFPNAKPNNAHVALAALEAQGKLKAVVTQNIDGLHQAAGSKAVYELHGSVHRNACLKCGKKFTLEYVVKSAGVPRCDKCGGLIKPDVVLYGEPLNDGVVAQAVEAISQADCLIIGGTSLVVYPAAGLIQYFQGNNIVLINQQSTPYDDRADLVLHEDIAQVFAPFTKGLHAA